MKLLQQATNYTFLWTSW